ncbi:hypothetical protein KCU62_g5418, partial [Aureobasidium sp. EXF-3399]
MHDQTDRSGCIKDRWNEEQLRRIITRATTVPFPSASALHPTAFIVADSVIIPKVPRRAFDTIRALLPTFPATESWKLNYCPRTSSNRGKLTVTMPSYIHEAFAPFALNMANQIYTAGFLPAPLTSKHIKECRTTKFRVGDKHQEPDSALCFWNVARGPFLVLEVAYSQLEADALRKAQRYIVDSRGVIAFVVVIVITKGTRSKPPADADPVSVPMPHSTLSRDHDTVHVHVHRSVRTNDNKSTGTVLINRVQIFPTHSPCLPTFTVEWSDINYGTWSDFVHNYCIAPDTPSPVCNISLDGIVTISESHADHPCLAEPGINWSYVPPLLELTTKGKAYLESSIPEVQLSSSDSASSTVERRLDPDYQPSMASTTSSARSI